jgi:hypothetical protein
MRRTLLTALAALLLVSTAAGLPAIAQTADNAVSIRLADAPTDRADDPRARIYIVDHLRQGDQITRHVEVGNGTNQTLTMEVYAAGATVRDGQWKVADGRAQSELSSWTTVSPKTLVIPAKGSAQATVAVTIPDDAVDGERYAVVWAQPPGSSGAVGVVNRVGVRMYVSVGEGPEPITDFRIDNLVASRDADARPVVAAKVTNTGRRAIDLSGELELTDGPGSLSAGPFPVQLGTTLGPGESARATVTLDADLPDGPWKATVTVTSGEETRKAQATITFPSEAGASATPVTAESVEKQRRILLPLALALLLAVVLALLLLAWRRRRRRDQAA